MSRQKAVLREIAEAINRNGDFRIADWVYRGFQVHFPDRAQLAGGSHWRQEAA
jgi:hypothetical protein